MLKSLFFGNPGQLVAIGSEHPRQLVDKLTPYAQPGTIVGGYTKKGDSYVRFSLRHDLPVVNLSLRVIYLGTTYEVKVPVQRIADYSLFDGELTSFDNGALLHVFGVSKEGKLISYPSYYKRLGEVVSCTKCPFWSTGNLGEKECARLNWQPAGLHYLHEAQCRAEDRQAQGMRLVKIYDYHEKPASLLGQEIWRQIKEVRNATTKGKFAEVKDESKEERSERVATKAQLSAFSLQFDHDLAEAGCEWPLYHLEESSLKAILAACGGSRRIAAEVLNHNEGLIPTMDELPMLLEAVGEETELESIEHLLETAQL